MKRMHIHVGVENIADGINFYNTLFNAEPVKAKADYAKWVLDDPRINFAISTRAKGGVDHLGLQVDDEHELQGLRARLQNADMPLYDEGETVCCYARSDKSWLLDPAGIAWETYRTMEDAQVFSDNSDSNSEASACCTPATKAQPACCEPSEKTKGCCN